MTARLSVVPRWRALAAAFVTAAALFGVVLVPGAAPVFAEEVAATEPPNEGPEVEEGPSGDRLADDGRPVLEAPGDGSVPVEDLEPMSEVESEALAEAAATGEPVEVVAQRSELGEVWALPSGDLEGRGYVVPRWTRQDGGWVRVDTTLEVTGGGMVAPVASTVGTEFSGGGDAPLVRLVKAGRVLELSWPDALPTPVLEGDTAVYREVFDGVDLRMTATEAGYTSFIVVKTPEAASLPELAEIRFGLRAEGLDVTPTAAGGFEARDRGAAGVVFEAPQASMWDTLPGGNGDTESDGDSGNRAAAAFAFAGAEGDEGDAGSVPGEPDDLAEVETQIAADDSALTLVPDRDLLTDPATTFPVVIDPQTYAPKAGAWASPNKSYPDNMGWKFNGATTQGLGTCTGWSDCPGGSTYRLLYQFDVSKFKGKRILSAEFSVKNTHSAVCSNHRVDLWRVGAIDSSNTSWNKTNTSTFWKEQIANASFHFGGNQSTCNSPGNAEFGIKDTVQRFADEGWSRLTLGMRAYSETDKSYWKKFSSDAFVRVTYNSPPNRVRATQLSMNPGGSCAKLEDMPRIRAIDQLVVAQATDPDAEDRLQVRFTITDTSNNTVWTSGLVPSSSKKNGSAFSVQVPSAEIPENKTLRWAVRVWDGNDTSKWSYEDTGWRCHFVYDTNAPAAPKITSDRWSASNPANPDDPWLDGVGQSGDFNFSSTSSDVVKYRYEINAQPTGSSPEVSATRAGFWLMPEEPGVYTINAKSVDAAGNLSEGTGTYQVRIGSGRPAVSTWGFDGEPGDSPVALSGDARITRPDPEASGNALVLDGTGDAATAPSSERVTTRYSFAVEAWVWLDAKTPGQAVVVSQTGPDYMDYKLYYSGTGGTDHWVFARYTSDRSVVGVGSQVPVRTGRWTHLVGVHNSMQNQLLIYVDGVASTPRSFSDPVSEAGPVTIGAGRYSATANPTSFLPGKIDDVRLYNRFVPEAEAKLLSGRRPLVASRWSFESLNADGRIPNEYVKSSGVRGPVLVPVNGAALSWDARVGENALSLDGTQHAYTLSGEIPVDTSESLTIAAHVASVGDLTGPATVMSLTGSKESALQVRALPRVDDTGARVVDWELVLRSADGSGGTVSRLTGNWTGAFAGEWNHVAVTYDPAARSARLWINGVSPGEAKLDEAEMFTASGRAAFGARLAGGTWGEKWPGLIDDAWIFRGELSGAQVGRLAMGEHLPTAIPGAGS